MEQECQGTFIYLTSVVGFIAISVIKVEEVGDPVGTEPG